MAAAHEWAFVALCIVAFATFVGFLFIWSRTRMIFIGFSHHNWAEGDEPVYLPYFAAAWAVATATALAVSREYLADVSDPYSGLRGSPQHHFFTIGWRTNLTVFGVPIDSWRRYTVVICYQMTRAVIGSLVTNVFMPFVGATLSGKGVNRNYLVSTTTARRALIGRALTSVFYSWSGLTDIIMSASQVDLAAFTLVSTIAADFAYGFLRITACNAELVVRRRSATAARTIAAPSITVLGSSAAPRKTGARGARHDATAGPPGGGHDATLHDPWLAGELGRLE